MNTIAGSTDELFDFAIVLAGTGQPMGGRNHKPMDDDAQATGNSLKLAIPARCTPCIRVANIGCTTAMQREVSCGYTSQQD